MQAAKAAQDDLKKAQVREADLRTALFTRRPDLDSDIWNANSPHNPVLLKELEQWKSARQKVEDLDREMHRNMADAMDLARKSYGLWWDKPSGQIKNGPMAGTYASWGPVFQGDEPLYARVFSLRFEDTPSGVVGVSEPHYIGFEPAKHPLESVAVLPDGRVLITQRALDLAIKDGNPAYLASAMINASARLSRLLDEGWKNREGSDQRGYAAEKDAAEDIGLPSEEAERVRSESARLWAEGLQGSVGLRRLEPAFPDAAEERRFADDWTQAERLKDAVARGRGRLEVRLAAEGRTRQREEEARRQREILEAIHRRARENGEQVSRELLDRLARDRQYDLDTAVSQVWSLALTLCREPETRQDLSPGVGQANRWSNLDPGFRERFTRFSPPDAAGRCARTLLLQQLPRGLPESGLAWAMSVEYFREGARRLATERAPLPQPAPGPDSGREEPLGRGGRGNDCIEEGRHCWSQPPTLRLP